MTSGVAMPCATISPSSTWRDMQVIMISAGVKSRLLPILDIIQAGSYKILVVLWLNVATADNQNGRALFYDP